jgi:hypothetical protein
MKNETKHQRKDIKEILKKGWDRVKIDETKPKPEPKNRWSLDKRSDP